MKNNNITIGSDPEFVIMCGDSVSNALEIFSKVFKEDLSCIEPEEPDYEDFKNFYSKNPAHHLNEVLNDINMKVLIENYKEIASQQFIDLFNFRGYEIKDIFKPNEIVEESLKEVSKLIIKDILKKYHKDIMEDKELQKGIMLTHIKQLDMYKLYNKLTGKEKITYNDFIINSVLEYENEHNDFDLLPNEIQEKILENIEENWEYDLTPDDGYEEYFCSAEIGCDGHSVTGEMRPRHGNEPIEHFNEILKLIKELQERLESDIVCYDKELQVKAGTVQGLARGEETILLGGHIHIGYDVEQKVYIAKYLGLMLSVFAGIPLTLIEKPEEIHMRHKIYGKWNDIRPKEYGLEFRMPSSWLVSPEITIGALSLAYVVADEFITKSNTGIKSSSIDLLFEGTKKYEDIYYKMLHEQFDDIDSYYYDKLISISETLYKNIKTMRLYPEYKEYIDYIFNTIEKGEYWNSDADILVTWSELF